jgi:hypothetical protein
MEPLPYHAVSQYPYAVPHRYPQAEVQQRYQEFYNTRPALRSLRPLRRELDQSMAAFSPYLPNP